MPCLKHQLPILSLKCNFLIEKRTESRPLFQNEVFLMLCNEALQYIHSLNVFGSRPGLERITELLESLGNPQDSLEIIHVAGTNGKGSTSTMLSSILRASGKKTGLYISPYVTEFCERIQIDGTPIPKEELGLYTERVKSAVESIQNDDCPITEFEFITAVAFLYFKEQGCDAVVLEVGLGGRLDATNVIKHPKASVIARIALDHTGILGESEGEIAFEKCGIIKTGCPVITTADNSPEALSVIEKTAQERNCILTVTDPKEVTLLHSDIFGSEILCRGENFKLSLAGRHQISNALNAIAAIRVAYPEISLNTIKKGLENAVFPARCEVISTSPLVILDGSHNPNGTEALNRLLTDSNIKDATAIVGFMADKDVSEALQYLKGKFKRMITVKVQSNPRTMEAQALAELCRNICDEVSTADSYENAIALTKTDNVIIVFGSLYLAGDVRSLLLQSFRQK